MLDGIIAFSLRNRALVAVSGLLVAVYGSWVALRLPVDVLPDLNRPTVTIISDAHGLVPEHVEQLVTRPIEQALSGATGVVRVRSTSGLGLSVVYAEFGWDTEIHRNRQIVQEKLQLATPQLPADVVPQMAPIASVMGQIQLIGVRSRDGARSVADVRDLVDRVVRLRLAAVPGVAQIVVIGGAPRQLQVIVDADELKAHDVTLEDVADAIRGANLNGSGGVLEIGAKGPLVTVTGMLRNDADLALAMVKEDPVRPVRLGDVARTEFGPAAIRIGEAGVDGTPGVILVVFKQPDVDTTELTSRVDEEVRDLARTLPADVELLPDLYRQADFIARAVDNVTHAVRDGSILVVVVLFLFLLNLRTTAITLTALPLSIAITAIVFDLADISINTMTLGGLAVAVGALVDDAIVDVENVFRRLKQNRAKGSPLRAREVVFRASREVRRPIVTGTLVVAAVYLPLFALTGMEGRLFTPVGIAYIVSILASLLVSLTLTPVLCSYLLPQSKAIAEPRDGWLVRTLKPAAARLIRFSMDHAVAITAVLAALVVGGVLVLLTRGSEFLPPFNEGSAQINLALPPGTSLEVSDQFGRRLEQVVATVPGVSSVARRTGRAEGDEHAEGANFTEAIVSFDPRMDRPRDEALAEIRARIAETFPGVATSVEQPLAHLLSHLLSGVSAQVAIKIQGPDLAVLRDLAGHVEAAVRPIPGVADLIVEPQVLVDHVEVKPRRDDLARFGLGVAQLAETVELALEGARISRMAAGAVSYPIVIRLEEKDRRNLDSLRDLLLVAPSGERLRVADVADVRMTRTANNVNRENVSRRIVVQHNVQDRSLGEVVRDVDAALATVRAGLPQGYSLHISGQFEAQSEAATVIVALSVLSLAVLILLMYAHFQSFALTMQALLNIPMAFVGAVAFIIATGQTVSIATLVGLISLGGIAVRNKILLLDHYLHLMREEGEPFSRALIIRAGQERMVPVLMTALCSGIALIPLVLEAGQPGREVLHPVASVIVGGLVSSTLLDFLLTPGVFWTFGRKAAERIVARTSGGGDGLHSPLVPESSLFPRPKEVS